MAQLPTVDPDVIYTVMLIFISLLQFGNSAVLLSVLLTVSVTWQELSLLLKYILAYQ